MKGKPAVRDMSGPDQPTVKSERPESAEVGFGRIDLAPARETLRWAFPSGFAVIAVLAFVGWSLGASYLTGFYGYFGLTVQEAGVDYLEILQRATYAIGPGLLLLGITLLVLIISQRFRPHGTPKAEGFKGRRYFRYVSVAIFAFTAVFAAAWILMEGPDVLKREGLSDADQISTTGNADYYVTRLQSLFGAKTVVAYARWAGPESEDPLIVSSALNPSAVYAAPNDGTVYNLVRILAQSGEVTSYLNIADCVVYRIPTVSIVLANPRLNLGAPVDGVAEAGSSPIPSCPTRIGEGF
ncbi:hypothetical protein [Nakamurella sp.]|uniref:hypothetical protein n=1 Tax=Nakamurella sp. TaxID=1869182 RepID=UPI003B3B0A62